ncbi:DUF2065 domain-containing protein [Chelatococcus reniformis]|uniref:DUF2065 domain-containing protein n=1 Tax=Chelatococcus reniformis TaxID=1494448 RepID=A0A916XMI5_9HYPH|nr:DUF2065 domain-containing protein [Chelatococcus reniformis]GGC84168.1 hypothetical protein GCM10010994_47600 [Chelatococcus reniformis]
MHDLMAAFGLLLAIEGICFAAFPSAVKKAAADMAAAPVDMMRLVGITAAAVGVGLVWLMRNHVW